MLLKLNISMILLYQTLLFITRVGAEYTFTL